MKRMKRGTIYPIANTIKAVMMKNFICGLGVINVFVYELWRVLARTSPNIN
jgi:hypothetical protein